MSSSEFTEAEKEALTAYRPPANQLGMGGGIGGGIGYVLSNRLKNPNLIRHALMSVTFSIFGYNVVQFTGIKKNLEEAILNGSFQATFPDGNLKNVVLGEMISNPDQRQAGVQQLTGSVQQQPETIQQSSMIRHKSTPVQDNPSFVSYQDLHSRQYLDGPTETAQRSSQSDSQLLEMSESNQTPMDPQPIQPSNDYFPPGSHKPKRYNKYGDEVFED